MRDDDIGGGGGPFAYFPVSAGAHHDTAADIGHHSGELDAIRRQLDGAHRLALRAVDGILIDPIQGAPDRTHATADRIARTAAYAAGCLHLFADFVHQYDQTCTNPRSVALLNQAYTEARLSHFGLDEADYDKGGPKADRDDEADWRTRDAALIGPRGSLTIEYEQLQARLGVQAEGIAAMLRRGPNPDDVRTLWILGALPSRAETLWPEHDLAHVPLLRLPPDLRDGYDDPRDLYDLTQDELYDLAVTDSGTDGFRPAGLLFAQWAQDHEPSDEVPPPWETLDDALKFILLDPGACFGDGASVSNCGLEVLGFIPFGKPIKAIKAYRAVRRLERAPDPGPSISPIHTGRQGKHIRGHPHFDPRGNRSILEADPHLIRKLAGTGTPRGPVARGQPGFKEVVDCGFPVGIWKTMGGKQMAETTNAMIVYAKDGIHIYPWKP